MKYLATLLTTVAFLGAAHIAMAREYFVGGPVHQHDMEIVANYLVGIEMAPMQPDMLHGPDVIHLEADVHATADNVYGIPDGAWVPYLTIEYAQASTSWFIVSCRPRRMVSCVISIRKQGFRHGGHPSRRSSTLPTRKSNRWTRRGEALNSIGCGRSIDPA
jgi:hypothetical protein